MKSRYPSPEERKLWHESNRFTKRVRVPPTDADSIEAETPSPEEPSPAPSRRTPATVAPLRAAPAEPLAPLPARDAARRFKAHATVEATLDLHGYSKEEAYEAVGRFLKRQQQQHHRHVTIITGKGRTRESVLRRELPHWLNEPRLRPLISAFAAATPEKGGTGVTHVLLKKRRD